MLLTSDPIDEESGDLENTGSSFLSSNSSGTEYESRIVTEEPSYDEDEAPLVNSSVNDEDEDEGEDDSDEYEETSENEKVSTEVSSKNENSDGTKVEGTGNNTVSSSSIFDSFNYNSGGDLSFSCRNCESTIKTKEYGKIKCPTCSTVNYRYNLNENIHVTEFRTLSHSPDDNYRFKKLLSEISNAIIGKQYFQAFKLCEKASIIAPGEPVVWELFAQTEYFALTRKQLRPKQGYIPHSSIISQVEVHLKRAKFHSNSDEYAAGEVVAGGIADDIINVTKAKLGQFRQKRKKKTKEKMYSKVDLRRCLKLLPQFKSAYKLSGDTSHLKAYIDELSKEYKWIIEKLDGTLTKMPNVRKFDPVKERNYFIKIVQNEEPDYEPPRISKERLSFDFSFTDNTTEEDIPGIIFEEE